MCPHIPNKGEQMVPYYGYSSKLCRGNAAKGKRRCEGWHSGGGVCPNSAEIGPLPHNSCRSRQTGPYIVASFTSPAGKNPPQPQDVDKPFPLIQDAIFCILDPPKSEFLSLIPFGIIHVIRPGYSLWFFITHVLLPMSHLPFQGQMWEFYFKYTALRFRFVACL